MCCWLFTDWAGRKEVLQHATVSREQIIDVLLVRDVHAIMRCCVPELFHGGHRLRRVPPKSELPVCLNMRDEPLKAQEYPVVLNLVVPAIVNVDLDDQRLHEAPTHRRAGIVEPAIVAAVDLMDQSLKVDPCTFYPVIGNH